MAEHLDPITPETWLLEQLNERKQKNPSFSLRAFARLLGVSPALISQVTRGRKKLSERFAFRIAERLKLDGDETERLLELIRSQQTRQRAIEFSRFEKSTHRLVTTHVPADRMETAAQLLEQFVTVVLDEFPKNSGPANSEFSIEFYRKPTDS